MKSKDQQFLEEAYLKVLKEGHPDDPRENKADNVNRRVDNETYSKEEIDDSAIRNQERNAGVDNYDSKPIGQVYKNKLGKEFIYVPDESLGKVVSKPVKFWQGEDTEDGRYDVEYIRSWNEEENKEVHTPTGERKKLGPFTQYK